MNGEMKNPYKILVRKHEQKRPLGSPRYTWEHNKKYVVRAWTEFIWLRTRSNGQLLWIQ